MQPKVEVCSQDNHVITISNVENGEVVCYSLVLIKGVITTQNLDTCKLAISFSNLKLSYSDINNAEHVSEWPVVDMHFKCIVELHHGTNQLALEYCGSRSDISINYRPRNSSYCVTPLYIICDGHDGCFQAPQGEDNSIHSACEKIALGAKLVQCLVAEKLHERGLGRKSFQLDADLNPTEEPCKVFYSKLPVERAYGMNSGDLWEHFGRELMSSPLGASDRKFLAFLSCTKYTSSSAQRPKSHDEILTNTQAHVALGGGGLAIFGSACLHTWPKSVDEIIPRFLDTTKIDHQKLMDDSCFRGTFGGCFATTLGATCHELGHTFDLGHTQDGIMSRGFDNVDLVFTLSSVQDKNKNLMSRGSRVEPQHSTVCFTVDLNVTYTMSSPISRRRNRSGRSSSGDSREELQNASPKSSARRMGNGRDSPSNTRHENRKSVAKDNGADDLTFWSTNCAAILYYHKWFNNSCSTPQSYHSMLRFDEKKCCIMSPSGVRVVEVRDQGGMVLKSWEFIQGGGEEEFTIPRECLRDLACSAGVFTIVAEDTVGNVLKQEFRPQISAQ